MAKKIIILLFCFIVFALPIYTAQAGFGVSPPFVKSERLRPGTQYERRINLLRSSADEDLEARITIDAPEIESWITIDKGLSFILPKNELHVPMVVKVDVPSGAALGDYSGQINVSVAPAKDRVAGVAVSLGALIDVNLTLTNEIFSDFKIRQVKIPDFADPGKLWNNKLFSRFFRRIWIDITIENTGNIEIAPSRVTLDVYGIPAKVRLESMAGADIKKVKPYKTEEITVSFPTKLGVGQYWGIVKIYKGDEILYTDQIAFTIATPGTLAGYSSRLRIWPWMIAGAIGLSGAIALLALAKTRVWRRIFRISAVLSRPWRIINRGIASVWLKAKIKFWRWLRNKSAPAISKTTQFKRKWPRDEK